MPLIERLSSVGEARVWYGDMPLESEYTVGIAGEKFLRALKDRGVVLGAVCPACEVTYVPPSMYCEMCLAQLDDWVEVESKGTIFTFTVLTRSLDDGPLDEPQIIALIEIEGAHGGLVHRLGAITPEEVEIGMQVQAVFKPKKERKGSILDIEYFKPT